jgi:hypothetical protein
VDVSALDLSDIQTSDTVVDTLAGSGALGTADSTDGTGATAEFQQPDDIVFVSDTLAYVSDTEWVLHPDGAATIRSLDLGSGETQTVLGGAESYGALAYGNSSLYVVDYFAQSVKVWDTVSASPTLLAGGAPGDMDGFGAAVLMGPWGGALDSAGQYFYMGDWDNAKIKRLDVSTTEVVTIAGSGAYGANNGAALSASFRAPTKVNLGPRHLFIADSANCAVRVLDLTAAEVGTIVGGQNRCDDGDGTLANAGVGSPISVLYSPTHGIFVGSGHWGVFQDYQVARASIQLIH